MTPHNPDQLTPEQVGVSEGWRLLNVEEIEPHASRAMPVKDLEYFTTGKYWAFGCYGNGKFITYRTKLAPSELLRARGLA